MQPLDKLLSLRAGLGLALVPFAVACTAAPAPAPLPSAQLTPHAAREAAVACGEDVAWNADPAPDLRYAFTYDAAGNLAHAEGVYPAGGSDDAIDYAYDAAGNFTHMLETNGPGQSRFELTAAYDAAGNLTDYAWATTAPGYSDQWDFAMSDFAGPNQPRREVMTGTNQPAFGYALAYDATGRLVTATPDSGAPTTWTYDDAAGTITIDTGSGAVHGVVTYDAEQRELSEVWGGTDPAAIASSDVFAWSGDDLTAVTYSSGTSAAPQTLSTVETDTLRYDCAAARARRGERIRVPGAQHAR